MTEKPAKAKAESAGRESAASPREHRALSSGPGERRALDLGREVRREVGAPYYLLGFLGLVALAAPPAAEPLFTCNREVTLGIGLASGALLLVPHLVVIALAGGSMGRGGARGAGDAAALVARRLPAVVGVVALAAALRLGLYLVHTAGYGVDPIAYHGQDGHVLEALLSVGLAILLGFALPACLLEDASPPVAIGRALRMSAHPEVLGEAVVHVLQATAFLVLALPLLAIAGLLGGRSGLDVPLFLLVGYALVLGALDLTASWTVVYLRRRTEEA